MQYISTTSFGRRSVSAGDLAARALARAPLPRESRDKWAILRDLTEARTAFGVSDRDLAVLSALISFHPHASLLEGDGTVVFPSNAALSARAHGMAESTLRRHLAALTRAGLILRRDSPNGKRYARRAAQGGLSVAYGFDLRPLLTRDAEIITAAQAAREAAERKRQLREAVVLALRDAVALLPYAAEPGDTEERLNTVRRLLRRKLDLEALVALRAEMQSLIDVLETHIPLPDTEEVSGNDARNERHIQDSNKDLIEYERPEDVAEPPKREASGLTPQLVLSACPEAQTFSESPVRDWESLHRCAGRLRPMLGITDQAWNAAQRVMGPLDAAITVLGILQRFGSIRSPGAYLRSLTQRAAKGSYSPRPMIMALIEAQQPANGLS
ncbi:MAG: replication initiation protein [Rhodobacteraceae bacterium]|nr:replication initiation protein [Paracoccaceae bacterium]